MNVKMARKVVQVNSNLQSSASSLLIICNKNNSLIPLNNEWTLVSSPLKSIGLMKISHTSTVDYNADISCLTIYSFCMWNKWNVYQFLSAVKLTPLNIFCEVCSMMFEIINNVCYRSEIPMAVDSSFSYCKCNHKVQISILLDSAW